jgi:hypothetical protein
LTDWELKSVRQRREQRFQELRRLWMQAKEQGMTHKIWKTVGGPSVRASHMSANDQKVTIDEVFIIGEARLFLPSDPKAPLDETANCRCNVIYTKEESAGSEKDTSTRKNPTRAEIIRELQSVSTTYNVPAKALIALISTESDFRQFGPGNSLLINEEPTSSAGGLGQITRTTANLYGEDYERLLRDWKYNLNVAGKIFAFGYFHAWNRVSDLRIRAARAYGIYHDGLFPANEADRYSKTPRGLVNTPWEKRYLSRYG